MIEAGDPSEQTHPDGKASDPLLLEDIMADDKTRKILNVDLVSADELRVVYTDSTSAVYTVEQLATLQPKDAEEPDPE